MKKANLRKYRFALAMNHDFITALSEMLQLAVLVV